MFIDFFSKNDYVIGSACDMVHADFLY